MRAKDFEGSEPEFLIEKYFAGDTRAWGVVYDRSEKMIREFTVDLRGEWDEEQFVLEEDFVYSDGETDRRVWKIRKLDENTYEGTADDVEGVAIGKRYGKALHWNYVLNLKVDEDTWKIRFDDWMFLQADNVLFNRAVMSKFGVKVGEVLIFFKK